jgi:hypothetical protein
MTLRCGHHDYSDFALQVGYHLGREIGMTERPRCHSCCLRSALLPRREGGVKLDIAREIERRRFWGLAVDVISLLGYYDASATDERRI